MARITWGLPEVDVVEFDVVTTITRDHRAQVTRHAVEEGDPPADHIIVEPSPVSFQGVIGDSPGIIGRQLREPPFRAQPAYDKLVELHELKTIVTFESARGVRPAMVITSLSDTETADTGDAIYFDITLEPLTVVASEEVPVDSISDGEGVGATNAGLQAPKTPPSPGPAPKNTSALLSLGRAL